MNIIKNLSVSHDGAVTPTSTDIPELRHVVKRVRNGEIELYAEAYLPVHAAEEAPVILLSEAEAPSSRWPDELLRGIAERAGGAIWFDTRDSGRSSWVDEHFGMEDLMADVLVVLDAFEVDVAHVFGRSMGGQIAQLLALAVPDRVESLMLLSTTPGHREELGMPAEWLVDKMTERLFDDAPPDLAGRANWLVEQWEWFAGPVFGFDRTAALEDAADEVATRWRGPNGHGLAVVEAPDIIEHLGDIAAPATIIHGTADPVFPVEHGHELHRRLPHATLHLIEGLGHELPKAFTPQLLDILFPLRRK